MIIEAIGNDFIVSLQPFSDLVHVDTADVCCPCCKYISVGIQNGDEDEFVAFAHHPTPPHPFRFFIFFRR